MNSMHGSTLAMLALLITAGLLAGLFVSWPQKEQTVFSGASRMGVPPGLSGDDVSRAALQGAPGEAYPGGNTPAPVPTQTDIPPGSRKYVGWTGQQVADDLIAILESTNRPWAIPPTTYEDSAVITPAMASNFRLDAAAISFQSPNDIAVVLSGDFKTVSLALRNVPQSKRYRYLLLLVDEYSGSWRQVVPSDDLQPLLDRLY